jgi:hypothetical protein
LPNKTIEYLGTGKVKNISDTSIHFNDMANFNHGISGEQPLKKLRITDSIGLIDSLKHWLFAKEREDTTRLFGFYHPDFTFSDGTLENWKKIIINNLRQSDQTHLRYILSNVQEKKKGDDFVEIIANIKKTTRSGASEQNIEMIWKLSSSKWKIIREQESFQPKAE